MHDWILLAPHMEAGGSEQSVSQAVILGKPEQLSWKKWHLSKDSPIQLVSLTEIQYL